MVIEYIQYISIAFELLIAVLGILMISKKNRNGWFFLITFGIYVFYDFAKLRNMSISINLLYASFFIATLSALILAWNLYRGK